MVVTIKDVAKAANVSVATVSRVLNNTANVTEKTREDVLETIKRLNYSPNFLGRNLRKCQTNVILVIVPTVEHEFYTKIITGMQKVASALGYQIISAISDVEKKEYIKPLEMLYNRTVDAAVIFSAKMNADEVNDISNKFNIALCCESVENADVLTVTVSDKQAAYDATKILIDKGCKNIGIVCADFPVASSIKRLEGYKAALLDNDIAFDEQYVYQTQYTFNSGKQAIDYFMGLDNPPSGIFAISDLIAAGVINGAASNGINVGTDLKVIGFDGIILSETYLPAISTVDQPSNEIGEMVIKKLIGNIEAPIKDKGSYIIPHNIILRQSTGD